SSVDADERRALEQEFLDVVRTWLDGPRFALVEAAVLESDPPPVLPICLLASILDGWKMLYAGTDAYLPRWQRTGRPVC
ncbi:MAG: hypothetical protein ACOX52_09260, partial [Verrucomicrobiota bacterium]